MTVWLISGGKKHRLRCPNCKLSCRLYYRKDELFRCSNCDSLSAFPELTKEKS